MSSSTAQYKTSDAEPRRCDRRPDFQLPTRRADRMVESTVRSGVRVRCRRWAILYLMLVENKRGNYSFLKGIAPYSAGVVAEDGLRGRPCSVAALYSATGRL